MRYLSPYMRDRVGALTSMSKANNLNGRPPPYLSYKVRDISHRSIS